MEVQENELQDKIEYPEAKVETRQKKGPFVIYPNGKQGVQYQAVLRTLNEGINILDNPRIKPCGVVELQCEGLSLSCEKDHNLKGLVIKGCPENYGTFNVNIIFRKAEKKESEWTLSGSLIINPDPRKLWKNIPTPEDIEYFKSDTDQNYLTGGGEQAASNDVRIQADNKLNIVAASMRGRSHAHEGKPRDDDFAIKYFEKSQWYVAVVADGAGSAKYSRQGSKIVCEAALSVCKEHLDDSDAFNDFLSSTLSEIPQQSKDYPKSIREALYPILSGIAVAAVEQIKKECTSKENGSSKDFSTTLLVTICKKFGDFWFIASFGIGDGIIGIQKTDDSFEQMSVPDSGEYAGQTRFITSGEVYADKNALKNRILLKVVPDFKAIYLMTDGISDPFFETDANLKSNAKWKEFVAELNRSVAFANSDLKQVSEQLLEWLNFWSTGNHDDRTIAVIY